MSAVDVVLRDVTLRDGLQDERPLSVDDRTVLFDALVAAGVRDLELTSFVHPTRVPSMAHAEELVAATRASERVVRWGLVLNRRGAERAVASGLRHLQMVVSVSESHQRHNARSTVDDAMAAVAPIVAFAADAGAEVELTLATAFGCPFEGRVPPTAVCAVAEQAVEAGVVGLGVADTIGTAVPAEVTNLLGSVRALGVPVGVHLHDTRGLAIANAFAALDAGASRIDGSVGGLGGCPFAPGATGNLALEDLAHALEESGVVTDVDVDRLVSAGELACRLTGRSPTSRVAAAGRRFR
jgi:hydroxymethylglutaryl-CoA lyase